MLLLAEGRRVSCASLRLYRCSAASEVTVLASNQVTLANRAFIVINILHRLTFIALHPQARFDELLLTHDTLQAWDRVSSFILNGCIHDQCHVPPLDMDAPAVKWRGIATLLSQIFESPETSAGMELQLQLQWL